MKDPEFFATLGWVSKGNQTWMHPQYPDQMIKKDAMGWVHLKLNFERDTFEVVRRLPNRADLRTYLASLDLSNVHD